MIKTAEHSNKPPKCYESWRRLVRCAPVLSAFVLLILVTSCDEAISKRALPAPLPDKETYEMKGRARRMWGGDNFEFGQVQQLHYVLIRGITAPKPGQPTFNRSWSVAWNMINGGRRLRIEVKARDKMQREIADVYVVNPDPADIRGDINVGLEILRGGYAWYNGEEFEQAQQYKEAEADARKRKVGIWANKNPIAPWDFEAKKYEAKRKRLEQRAGTALKDND